MLEGETSYLDIHGQVRPQQDLLQRLTPLGLRPIRRREALHLHVQRDTIDRLQQPNEEIRYLVVRELKFHSSAPHH